MRAIVCKTHGEPETMQLVDVPRPSVGLRDVLIRSEAIGVNFVDTMRRSGRHPAAPAAPFTPGIEVCGVVAETGEDVQRFQVGQRVIGRCVTHGAYAEYVATEERFTVEWTDGIAREQAAALFVNPQTAYHALKTMGQLQAGERVLITAAAGGVGLAAVQIAKSIGGIVIALARGADKLELARGHGADFVVDYSQATWSELVLEATSGQGVDLILESVGGAVAKECLRCWAFGGRMVVYGKASEQPAIVTTDELLFGNRSVHGMALGTLLENEELLRSGMAEINQLCHAGDLKCHIGHTFALADAADAHRLLESRDSVGKIVLLP